jgi:hypothetical protein
MVRNDASKLNEGILLNSTEKKEEDRTFSHNGKKETIRMPDITIASWGEWQVLYRLRRVRVLSKIIGLLSGRKR